MAVDLSEIAKLQRRRGSKCSVPGAIAKLPTAKRRMLEAALESDLTATAISEWLRGLGVELSEWTVNRHRRGGCRCGR